MDLRIALAIPLVLFLSSCYKGSTDVEEAIVDPIETDAALQVYMDKFIEEGNLRGLSIPADLNQITAVLTNINEGNTIGICYYDSQNPNHIEIDVSYWNSTNDYGREAVMFHELGHCYLNLDHDESEDNNGNCLSLMNSGTSGCRLLYNANNREYYLDQLFGSSPI